MVAFFRDCSQIVAVVVLAVVVLVGYVFIYDTSDTCDDINSSSSPDSKSKQSHETNSEKDKMKTEQKNDLNTTIVDDIKETSKNNSIDEGVIKYECEWNRTSSFSKSAIFGLLNARNQLYKLGLIGVYNENGIGFGNISSRIDDKNNNNNKKVSFYITGTQTAKLNISEINESHFSIVTNYDILNNQLFCHGPIIASSESMTHATIYELDENIQCIVHIHNNELWNKCINILPTTNKDVKYGTPEMAKEVIKLYKNTDLSKTKIFVMGGHIDGMISFAEDIESATNLIIDIFRKYCNLDNNNNNNNNKNEEEKESDSHSHSPKSTESTTESTLDNNEINTIGGTESISIIEEYVKTPVLPPQNEPINNGDFVEISSAL